jgi:pimeloyl-ACP methyl ester carboxylesterase
MTQTYQAKRLSESFKISIRGLKTAVRVWPAQLGPGDLEGPTLLLLHGWMDVSASFQFLVDCLPKNQKCVSFDWRGFGDSEHSGADSYWFADYVADLDFFIEAAQTQGWLPDGEVNLVAHSMGGNVAMIYAGVRPERVRRLVNLEGTGLPASKPSKAPERYRQWLGELQQPPRLLDYATLADVAARLIKTNPRLKPSFALYLAGFWAAPTGDGRYKLTSDPIHKISNPILYRLEEILACWRAITAPVMLALASDTNDWHQFIRQPAYQRRLTAIRDLTVHTVPDTGHMMHHDQPQALADLITRFVV